MKRSASSLLALCLLGGIVAGPAFAAKKKAAAPPPAPVAAPAPPVDPEAWRATAPGPGTARSWQAPEVKSFKLSNGVPVYVVQNDGLPLVTVQLLLKVGREANPDGKEGLGALTANLLDEGTKDHSGTELASEIALLGATLGVNAGEEGATVTLSSLAGESFGKSLDLMAEVVRKPAFGKADFTRVKQSTIDGIAASASEPREVAVRTLLASLYGASHPYGAPAIGTIEGLEGIKKGDVKKYYKRWWKANNAAIVVVGAITEAQARTELEARFGDWDDGGETPVKPPAPVAPMKTKVVFVEQPGAVQSVLRVATPTTARNSPEFLPAMMAGTLVGGMFSSPINMNLRETHGWSYGAFAGFSESRDYGTFSVRTQVQADKTAPAVTEILKELKKAADEAPAGEYLQMGKDNVLKSLAGNFETNAYTAESIAQIPRFGLGEDLWRTYTAAVEGLSGEQVAESAKRNFQADHMLVVVVGPRTVEVPGEDGKTMKVDVAGELEALGFDFEDKSGKKAAKE